MAVAAKAKKKKRKMKEKKKISKAKIEETGTTLASRETSAWRFAKCGCPVEKKRVTSEEATMFMSVKKKKKSTKKSFHTRGTKK